MKILFHVKFSGEVENNPNWTMMLYTLLEMSALPVKGSPMTLPTPADFPRGHGDIDGQVQWLEFAEHLTICRVDVKWHGPRQEFIDFLPQLLAIGYHERSPESARILMERSRRQPGDRGLTLSQVPLLDPEFSAQKSRSARADELYVGNIIAFRDSHTYVVLDTELKLAPNNSVVRLVAKRLGDREPVITQLLLKWLDTVTVIGQAEMRIETFSFVDS